MLITPFFSKSANSFHFELPGVLARADEKAGKLIEKGGEHVCNNSGSGRMFFRKPL
jgi:hypothetical protein